MLFRDPDVGRLYKHDSPYTYFSSAELHLGEISLECSRPGASAVTLWATQQLFPLETGGQFQTLMQPELDIVVYSGKAPDAKSVSDQTRKIFESAAKKDLHLAMFDLPVDFYRTYVPDLDANAETVTCLRSVLMKPEHGEWLDRIFRILEACASE